MPDPAPPQLTQVLHAAAAGDPHAADQLLPLVYSELRAMARARLARTPPGNTLQPTALVHEAYLRLIGSDGQAAEAWESRRHFFGAAAIAMRNILVDQARRKHGPKAGGGRKREDFDAAVQQVASLAAPIDDMLALDEVLSRLEAEDPRKAKVVMLKFFAGLDHKQIAEALGLSVPTVERDWAFARSWLQMQLSDQGSGGSSGGGSGGGAASRGTEGPGGAGGIPL